jgi:hypothetical protein
VGVTDAVGDDFVSPLTTLVKVRLDSENPDDGGDDPGDEVGGDDALAFGVIAVVIRCPSAPSAVRTADDAMIQSKLTNNAQSHAPANPKEKQEMAKWKAKFL